MNSDNNEIKRPNGNDSPGNEYIENPYRPHALESGEWFYQQDVIKKIKERFESQPEKRIAILQGDPGSGKTSILKRIENTPGLLGKNRIPIYLDSSKYMGHDANELLYSVSRDVIEKLNKFEYDIPIPEDVKKRRIKSNTFLQLLLVFDAKLKADDILILILDEFDKLLENIDVSVIADYIRISKHIEKDWSKYGIILTGDKRLVNLTTSETINQFLRTAYSIDIEDFLKKENVKDLIIEPVKKHLEYTNDAVERIIWYSGKNLFFQQLICYYLVKYLNHKNKGLSETNDGWDSESQMRRCSLEDVEQAVQQILKEEIREFQYAWKNKLPVEARIIASALADKRVTEKRGEKYSLKDNKLLENIFEGRMHEEIRKLQEFGYINIIQKGYFPGCPFKIPLYGKWIQQTYPFMKTVIESMKDIADRTDFSILLDEIKDTPGDQLIPFDREKMLEIGGKWHLLTGSIQKQKGGADKLKIKEFFKGFSRLLDLNMSEKPLPNICCFVIEIKHLNIGILEEAFCFIQDRPALTKNDIDSIENRATEFAEAAQTKLTLFFHLQKSDLIDKLARKPYLSLIPINENDIKRIIFSSTPTEIFRKIILSRLSLHKVSPYQTEGPAKAIFYGRSKLIYRLCSSPNKSFAVVGARKIGKTSLLYKIKETPPPNTAHIFMNLEVNFPGEEDVNNYKTFLKSLELEIERTLNKKINFKSFLLGRDLNKLPKIIKKLSQEEGKNIVFILDEIDGLIKFDRTHNFKLMRLFRTMAQDQENPCQFVFAGFKELYHHKRDLENPMYNFCEEIKLMPLDRKDALDLLTIPMESIGIRYKNEADRDLILEYTGGHPNLLQFFSMKLIEKIDRHDQVEDRRTIFLEDIKDIFNTTYEEYIMDDVYMFNSDLSDINKLTLILLAEEQLKTKEKVNGNLMIFSAGRIIDKLTEQGIKNVGVNDIHRNLKNLVMRFILLDKGKDKYCFALSIFPEILKNSIDRDFKKRIIKEILRNES